MNIVVCIKQVVDTNDIKWTKHNTIDREGAQSVINPCDVLALETALRLKDNNTKITVISMGPPQAIEALKTALAMGCDEAYLLCDKKFSGADTVATSRTLSTAIKHIQPNFDLIICGQYASDGDTAQTGPSIAQKLDIEQITYVNEVSHINKEKNIIEVMRETEDNIEIINSSLPALICINNKCPYEVRPILIGGYIKAQNTKIKILNSDDLNLEKELIGIKGSPTWVSKAFRAQSSRKKEILKPENIIDSSPIDILEKFINEAKQTTQKSSQESPSHTYNKKQDTKNKILIWGEINKENKLIDVVFQLASKANELALSTDNCKISVITTGLEAETYLKELQLHGVDELITIENPLLTEYNTKNYATVILKYLDQEPTNIFLIGATTQGRDLAPQISSALNTGLTADCTNLEIYDNFQLAATRPTFGGELMATILCKTQPQMATVRSGIFEAKKVTQTREINHKIFSVEIKSPSTKKVIQTYPIEKNKNSLENAKIVIAGGKGLKDKKTFEKLENLANLLNVKTGATRKAVDAGFASPEIQIGQTGKTISPDLYIAFGISGAIQHCVGVENAKKIIAINTDEKAPIIQNADYTIIADAQKIIDCWIERLNKN